MSDLDGIRALAAHLPEIQTAIQRDRERALEEIRTMVPGFVGRLDGARIFVTPREVALLRAAVPVERRPEDPEARLDLRSIDLILEEPG